MRLPELPNMCISGGHSVAGDWSCRGKTASNAPRSSPEHQFPSASEVKLEKNCRRCRRNRRGAAVVEFAVVAPVFFLLIFGMIEFGRAIMVQQILTNAAREGARFAVLDSTTPTHDLVVSKVTTYLQGSGITGGSVTITPTEPTSATYGQPVTVSVRVAFSNVSWLPSPFFLTGSQNLTASAVMRRETVQ
jgi:Flp pilus assembly protein TadG